MSLFRVAVESATGTKPLGSEVTRANRSGPEPSGSYRHFQDVFDKLTKWIPSETLAIYLPAVTLVSSNGEPSLPLLVCLLVVTPLFTVAVAFSTGAAIGRAVVIAAILGTIAFAIWSLCVPLNGWLAVQWIAGNEGLVAVGAAIAGTLFAYVAEGVVKRLTE